MFTIEMACLDCLWGFIFLCFLTLFFVMYELVLLLLFCNLIVIWFLWLLLLLFCFVTSCWCHLLFFPHLRNKQRENLKTFEVCVIMLGVAFSCICMHRSLTFIVCFFTVLHYFYLLFCYLVWYTFLWSTKSLSLCFRIQRCRKYVVTKWCKILSWTMML